MKKYIYFLIAFVVSQSYTYAQYTLVPDDNFEQALIDAGIDSNPILDNQILTSEAHAFNGSLSMTNLGISDLTGVEAFINMLEIVFNYNPGITNVDLSSCTSLLSISGIGCSGLTSINITGLANLTTLNLKNADLFALDVTTNSALKNLNLRKNSISSLDLSQNSVIDYVDLKLNGLTYLDLRNGNQENMLHFDSDGNSDLTCIFFDDASLIDRDRHIVWFIDDASFCLVDNEVECASCMSTLSVNDTVEVTYNMYPNPSDNLVHIATKSDNTIFSIYHITGKTILTKTLNQGDNLIDVSNFASGLYLAKFVSDNQIATKKLMIK
ncbi:T9SS type A sorting domain-containing protein [Xanthomarina sp. F2636L]|uniref:T9SS type A sorting domain-containing protein n=1 Tax=Xanthomarina sp. F2636L TaxID=2996018 RepID=UPI00225E1B50|nr:T9SS type A sorting domain-containing protein [Xanthomarina sp. F2636L]MCX7551005.1 T9SS type A sorting domain-containing protein [Xanthomarina sp. F2636L]